LSLEWPHFDAALIGLIRQDWGFLVVSPGFEERCALGLCGGEWAAGIGVEKWFICHLNIAEVVVTAAEAKRLGPAAGETVHDGAEPSAFSRWGHA
jgi:hypothetical protein